MGRVAIDRIGMVGRGVDGILRRGLRHGRREAVAEIGLMWGKHSCLPTETSRQSQAGSLRHPQRLTHDPFRPSRTIDLAVVFDSDRVVRVPGAYEIPPAAKQMAESGRYDAIVCLGAVIRGATPHFDYVSAEVSKGVASVSLDSGIPVAFGVLTTDTIEQAIERAGSKAGNKGFDAAMAAVEMANLYKAL